jgi:outer membrane protein TolC
LGTLLARQAGRAAEGERLQVRSGLLPHLTAGLVESAQQVDLQAFGFQGLPGIPTVIGPFSTFDARARLSAPILNFGALYGTRGSSENLKAADATYRDARDTVVQVVAALYLQALSGQSRIDAVRAQVATAETLHRQASDFRSAGTAPAIDVLRAKVELDAQQQRLIFFENEFEKQKLALGRAIGLPDGQPLRLTDQVPYTPAPVRTVEEAIAQASESRMDYQSAQARLRAAEYRRRAAAAERLPSVAFNGDYGAIGLSPTSSHGTVTAAVGVSIPIFQGGRVQGEVLAADAAIEQQRAELEDLRGRMAYEVRTAFLDLTAAGRQADVAKEAVDLAGQQVTQARDRFAAGVTSNLEVIQAQEALAAANENYISSLASYNIAKAALARAIGGAEGRIRAFLWGT